MKPTPTLLACALLACLALPADASAQAVDAELPLTGAAYRIAGQAYAAHARGEHAMALEYAREAVRLRPDVARLHALLAETERAAAASAGTPSPIAAAPASRMPQPHRTDWNTRLHRLQVAGAWPQAWQTVQRALAERPDDAALLARQSIIGRHLGEDALRRAWAADTAGEAPAAAVALDEALSFAPDLAAARLLQVRQQLHAGASAAATAAARDATVHVGENADAWLLLGLLLQREGEAAAATQVWRDGVQQVPAASAARLRLALADAALARADGEDARRWLQSSGTGADNDVALAERQRLSAAIDAGQVAPALLRQLPDSVPDIVCGEERFGVYCAVAATPLPSYALARHAQMQAPTDPATALAMFDAAALLAADGETYRRQADALRADQAYRALAAGDTTAALAMIARLDAGGALPDTMLADAGHAALRADALEDAAGYFRRSLDAADVGRAQLAPQPRFALRRTLAELDRDRGFIASASYRGDSSLGGFGGARQPGDNLQLGWEGYLRPRSLQRQGRYLEFHARLTGNAWSQDGAVTGGDSLQAAFGVRARPLRSQNLVLAVERLQHVGDAAIDDWLLRAAWSHSHGTDLRVDVPAWWSSQLYTEAGRYVDHGWTYAIGEWQAGRSRALGGSTVLTPHLAVVAEHNEAFAGADAFGAGPGLTLRRWFRADHYRAPRSWLEVSAQYRLRLGGDPRAEGWFVRVTLNH